MELTDYDKKEIAKRILSMAEKSQMSDARFAQSIGLGSGADISNLRREAWVENARLIGDKKWCLLAGVSRYEKNEQRRWMIADTAVKVVMDTQMEACLKMSMCGIFCDEAGIGKTVSCVEFARAHANVFYIDCSACRTRSRFIRTIASTIGISNVGKTDDVVENICSVLSTSAHSLLIFDEAGDLNDASILEIKRLYNSLEGVCGFYMVGADGLKQKIERGVAHKKVGFTEVLSRFGRNFTRVLPVKSAEMVSMMREMANDILTAQGTDKILIKDICAGMAEGGIIRDLRYVQREIMKIRAV